MSRTTAPYAFKLDDVSETKANDSSELNTLIKAILKDYEGIQIELDSLLYCVLKSLGVGLGSYQAMHDNIRNFILNSDEFKIIQGPHICPVNIYTRKMLISCK